MVNIVLLYYFRLMSDNLGDFIFLRFHFLAPVCIFYCILVMLC